MAKRIIHDWNYTIYMVDAERGEIVETLAHANNFDVAKAAFTATLQTRSWAFIELREKGRVLRVAKTLGYDTKTETIGLEWMR